MKSVLRLASVVALLTPPGLPAGALTVREGTNFAIDLSPDGAELVMDLQGHLWRLPATGGKARAITDGFGDDRLPRFSPDGRQIVFQSFRNGSWDIWLIGADGAGARALTSGPADDREPVWAPDGRSILFASDRGGNFDVWRIDVADGELHQLTADPADDYAPAVSRAGDFAFVSDRAGKPALYLQPPGASSRRLAGGDTNRLGAPAFSPTGERIALVAPAEEMGFPGMARNRLTVVDVRSGESRIVSAATEDVFAFAPAWAGDGRLFYTADGGLHARSVAGADRQDVTFAAEIPLGRARQRPRPPRPGLIRAQPVLGITEPVMAPDGSGVVLAALGDLWLRRGDGTRVALTSDPFVERDPVFSRDGRELFFISDRSGRMQAWVRDWATGEEREITHADGGVRYPTPSPDGSLLAFAQPGPRGDQDFTVQLLDRGSGDIRRLKSPPLWPGRMGWSSDGKRLMVAALSGFSRRSREGANRLLLLDVAGGDPAMIDLPGGASADFGPVVSPDGRSAVLVIDGSLRSLPLNADGTAAGAPREIAHELADYPSWSGDSATVTYLSTQGLARVAATGGTPRRLAVQWQWSPAVAAERTLVHAGRLFDGRGDGYRRDIDVVIDGNRIVSVHEHRPHPQGVRVIDAADQVVLPGLMENHAHHQGHDGEWVGRAWLSFGVTSVVEPGGLPYESRQLLESWESGAQPGPRLFFAGPQLDGERRYFPFASHITSAERRDWELQRADDLSYSLLKTYTRMPPAEQRRVIRQGRNLGLITSSHEVYPALAAGAGRVEHLRGTSRLGYSPKQSDLLRSYDDVLGIVGATRSVISPTVVVSGGFFSYYLEHPAIAANRQYVSLYPEAYRRNLQAFAQLVGRRPALLREGVANARMAIRELSVRGARIVAGTDAPIFPYGLSLIVELANYTAAGLTPAEALRTATSASAEALGMGNDLGSVEKGRLADLVIVAGDPLREVAELLNVTAVMRSGRYFTLDELLAGPERR